MEPLIYAGLGAGCVVALLIAKFGWTKVKAWAEARAQAAETALKAKVTAAAGDIDAKVKAAIDNEVTAIKADVAALKAKVGV